jgi:4-amino-4-deoxy-L-arabinose transferase-like glycosyltransferase
MARFIKSIRYFLYIGLFFGALYFFTRLFNLTILPIFTDEAIYIRWSQIGTRDAAWRFISLVDGKQPMFTWIMMVLLRFFDDPLVAGRLVSVLAGALSVVGMWVLSFELFKDKRISFWASLLYIISPFALMYDRLALYDSWVAAFSIWNLYLAILLVRNVRLDVALIFGLTLGAGMLNKSSGFLSLYLLPATLLLFDWSSKNTSKRLLKWVGLAMVAAFLSQMVYSILRLSPLFHMIGLKDVVFIYSLREWITHPLKFLSGNLHGLMEWLIHYMTWPVFIAALASLVLAKGKLREVLLLLAYWIVPIVGLASFGRVLYPRFVLFMSMPLLVLAAVSFSFLLNRFRGLWLGVVLFGVLLFPSIITDYYILTNPKYAPIPFADKGQLMDDWPSGWGIKESVSYLSAEAQKGKISIFTDGTFGLLPYSIELYLVDNPNVTIRGIWPMPASPSAQMREDRATMPTYLILNQIQKVPDWGLVTVGEWQKGNSKETKLRLLRFEPEKL